jgi:hypothetical protein
LVERDTPLLMREREHLQTFSTEAFWCQLARDGRQGLG